MIASPHSSINDRIMTFRRKVGPLKLSGFETFQRPESENGVDIGGRKFFPPPQKLSCLIFLLYAFWPELKWLKTWKFRENPFHQFEIFRIFYVISIPEYVSVCKYGNMESLYILFHNVNSYWQKLYLGIPPGHDVKWAFSIFNFFNPGPRHFRHARHVERVVWRHDVTNEVEFWAYKVIITIICLLFSVGYSLIYWSIIYRVAQKSKPLSIIINSSLIK